jgi:hypothetical protein
MPVHRIITCLMRLTIYTLTTIVQQEMTFRSRLENPVRDYVLKTRRNLVGPPHWPFLLSVSWAPDTTAKTSTYNVNFDTIEKAKEHLRVLCKCP